MARRRPRVELSAIASLDADVARARQQCEDHVRLAYDKLLQRQNGTKTSFHDRYLENLRHFFESEAAAKQFSASKWSQSVLRAFLGRLFSIYEDRDAFDGFCASLRAEGASYGVENGDSWLQIESFDVLKRALQRDTAARIATHDPQTQGALSLGDRDDAVAQERPSLRRPSSHRSLPSGCEASSAASSSGSDLNDLQDDGLYTVPANSVLVASELRVEVLKKSQNWLGRWRSRQLSLRWNELEMKKGRGATDNRHSIARSFPAQPAVAMATPTAHDLNVISSSSSSTKIKRYALQNLLSLQLIQLNESEPTRKLALDLHFKQAAANGNGFTTKSLIVTSDKPSVKDLMAKIATLTLFRGLVAGDLKAPMVQKLVQAGANVNAFCAIPVATKLRLPVTTLCPLQFGFLQYCQASGATREGALATVKMLLEAKADPRSLLHWHFARRVLLPSETSQDRGFESLFSLLEKSWVTAFGSDAHGWSLLMYASRMADLVRVSKLLQRVKESVSTPAELLKYIQHVSGEGETALHIAIRAARGEHKASGEAIALLIVETCVSVSGEASDLTTVLSPGDAEGGSLVHLAIKAKLWRLVDVLLKHAAVVSDEASSEHPIHLAIRSGAPSDVVAAMVQQQRKEASCGELLKAAFVLAVDCVREDIVGVLLQNGAPVSEVDISGDECLLSRTIRRGMACAARSIWVTASANKAATSRIDATSLIQLSVRRGMYRLGYEIATSIPSPSADGGGESRMANAISLAVQAGQLELASSLLDAMPSELDSERILKALLAFSAEQQAPLDSEAPLTMFNSCCVEDLFADTLARTETVDETSLSALLHSACSLRGGRSRRLLVLLLAFLRLKNFDRITELVTQCDGIADGTPVHTALRNDEFSSALQLLNEVLPKATDGSEAEDDELQWIESLDTTLLHLACQCPLNTEALVIVGMLLGNGAYARTWDSQGFTPLHIAIRHKCDARMIQIFAKHEQDLNLWSEATAIVTTSEALLGEGAAVPLTPLMAAIEGNNVAAFRELVLCGADVRARTPRIRLGLLQFAACRVGGISRGMIEALLAVKASSSKDVAEAMSTAKAKATLLERLSRLADSAPNTYAVDETPPTLTNDDNRVLRITLLGLQTPAPPSVQPDLVNAVPIPSTPPLSPARPSLSPPRSPLRRSFLDSEPRRTSNRHLTERQSREPSPVRLQQLDDDSLLFLHDEEKATLTLVAQEARTEAQEWLKKRSGQKKLLSEARALLQNRRDVSHRRTPSGTVIPGLDNGENVVVTDEQLLETHKALAAKQFIDKHVAEAVNEARAVIEREKMTILQSTGIFPGEMFPSHPGHPKDASIGSSSSSSTLRTPRTASMNSSMLLLFSGSESDTFLSELSGSGRSAAYRKASAVDDEILNPLERESFVHIADTRRSLS